MQSAGKYPEFDIVWPPPPLKNPSYAPIPELEYDS